MSKETINQVIAEYVGWFIVNEKLWEDGIFGVKKWAHDNCEWLCVMPDQRYTDSLDACIEVVEKLGIYLDISFYYEDSYKYTGVSTDSLFIKDKSPSLALATALATCINDINQGK